LLHPSSPKERQGCDRDFVDEGLAQQGIAPMKRFLVSAAITAALVQGAFAQGNGVYDSASHTNNPGNNAQSSAPLPLQLKQKLQSAGYSDVKIMPTSFVVQAKDKQGDPVEILITPHSIMEVTALNASEQNDVASSSHSNSTNGNQ
jgi:hypothetical protein